MAEREVNDHFERIVDYAFTGMHFERAEKLTGGVSADVYRLDLRNAMDQLSSVVLRIHGKTHSGHPAALEFELLQSLFSSDLPVAEPLALDTSGEIIPEPWLLMTFIEGRTAFTATLEKHFAAMASALASVHGADTDCLPVLPRRVDPVPELLEFLPPDAEWRSIHDHLLTLRETDYPAEPRLLHGDFWPENILWRNGELAAILDWEDAAVGDPLSDVACCRLEFRYIHGTDGMEAFTSAYEQQAQYAEGVRLDRGRLALWQLYVAAAAHKYMGSWGLPPEKEAHMHHIALETMRESTAIVLTGQGA